MMGLRRNLTAPLVAQVENGIRYEVFASGILEATDPAGNPILVVHVRISHGSSGRTLVWRIGVGWARDRADSLSDLPADFTDELEDVLEEWS